MPSRGRLILMFLLASMGFGLVARCLYVSVWQHSLVEGGIILVISSLCLLPLVIMYRRQRLQSQKQLAELDASNEALLAKLRGGDKP